MQPAMPPPATTTRRTGVGAVVEKERRPIVERSMVSEMDGRGTAQRDRVRRLPGALAGAVVEGFGTRDLTHSHHI